MMVCRPKVTRDTLILTRPPTLSSQTDNNNTHVERKDDADRFHPDTALRV